MSSPPQGFNHIPPTAETTLLDVVGQAYTANTSINSTVSPNVPVGQTIEWSIYFAFVGTQALLEHSIDNGVNFSTTFEDITSGLAYIVKIVVAQGDQVIFRFTKDGTINYFRVGQPI